MDARSPPVKIYEKMATPVEALRAGKVLPIVVDAGLPPKIVKICEKVLSPHQWPR
jgi:phosphoribosylformylglycinamidine (FGAM) synthase PurS component